jgi:RNA polymerase sigma-70 factor (ECF subfamily)
MEDSEIVDLYLQRDEAALKETSDKYSARLRRLADRILEDEAAAMECENDTYLKAWHSIPPHEPRTWLFAFLGRIIRHLAIDECRRRSAAKRKGVFVELTREMEECIPAKGGVQEESDADLLSETISAYLDTLDDDPRNIFVRRYWFFESVSEISRRYGFSESKVKSALHRTREGLRKYLEKEGYSL